MTHNGILEVWVTTNDSPTRSLDSDPGAGRPVDLPANSAAASLDGPTKQDKPQLIAIKFPGVAGRAERGGPHPFELLPERKTEIWAVNPLGYGGSEGRAALATTAASCEAIWDLVVQRFPDLPVAVIGNSFGCLSALYLAARKNVAGVYLRNPVPLQQLILGSWKYHWWNLGLARWIAYQVPEELDAVQNARGASAPLLMVSSERDRVCPWRYQQAIYSAYAGCKDLMVLQGADHHHPVPDFQVADYRSRARRFVSTVAAISIRQA